MGDHKHVLIAMATATLGSSMIRSGMVVSGVRNRCTQMRNQLEKRVSKGTVFGFGSAAFVGSLGDVSAQKLEGVENIDIQRTLVMTMFTALYGGGIYAYMFRYYDRTFTAARFGHRGALCAKVAFDNMVHTPFIYFPTFYGATGIMKGQSMQEIWENVNRTFLYSNLVSCSFWVPATTVLFAFVPLRLQVVFNNTANLCWSNILSTISNKSVEEDRASEPVEPYWCAEDSQCNESDPNEDLRWHHADSSLSPFANATNSMAISESESNAGVKSHEEDRYKVEYSKGLEDAGDQLDRWMKERWQLDNQQWDQVDKYRQAYKDFRSGDAHGCKGDMPHILEGDASGTYREQYRNFRTGRPHGCKTLSQL